MKAEAAAFLDKARECLAKAEDMLARRGRPHVLHGGLPRGAGSPARDDRPSVQAACERARGIRRHVKDDPRFDAQLRAFLGRSYGLKAMADYETGPDSKVSPELAHQAVETAKRFAAETEKLLNDV